MAGGQGSAARVGDAERRLRWFLRAWTFAGLSATAATVAWVVALDLPSTAVLRTTALVLAIGVAAAIADSMTITLPLGRTALSTGLFEAAVVLGFVLLPPPLAALGITVGMLISQLVHRRGSEKGGFNVAVHTVAALVAAAAVGALSGPEVDPTRPSGLLVLLVGAAAFGATNAAAMAALVRRLEAGFAGGTSRVFTVEAAASWGLSTALGLLFVIVVRAAPAAVPVLAVVAWLIHRSMRQSVGQVAQRAAEHERLERTVAGASEGIGLVGAAGEVELLNPAGAALLDAPLTTVRGQLLAHLVERSVAGGGAEITAALAAIRAGDAQVGGELPLGDRMVRYELAAAPGPQPRAVLLLSDVTEEREAETLRREFVARVSHELRTPLTAILGFAEMLQVNGDRLSPEARARSFQGIERQAQRLQRQVADLLWSSRIDTGTMPVHPQTVSVAELVGAVEQALGDVLREPLVVDVAGHRALVDEDHLERILTNLLVNAATYGAAPIAVRSWLHDSRVTIEVADAGDGVPPSFAPSLFESFAQASTGDRREARGLGLGLAIVASLADANGGSVDYERADGRTCFRVTLPAA